MGSTMFQVEGQCRFCIRHKDFDAVTAAIRSLFGKETVRVYGSNAAHFHWIDQQHLAGAHTIQELFERWRWPVTQDEVTSDIIDIEFIGEKIGDEDLFFETIGPFVEAGCFVTVIDETARVWRYVFNGDCCVKQIGRIVFEETLL